MSLGWSSAKAARICIGAYERITLVPSERFWCEERKELCLILFNLSLLDEGSSVKQEKILKYLLHVSALWISRLKK